MSLSLLAQTAEKNSYWLQYATVTVWLLIVLFSSYAVYRIWAGLVKGPGITFVLFPGALVSELAFVLGCLLSGATVKDVSLLPMAEKKKDEKGEKKKDEEDAKPKKTSPPVTGGFPKPKIPVLGHIFMGLIPILAAGLCIYGISTGLGHPVLTGVKAELPRTLPTTPEAWWTLPKEMVDLVKHTWNALGVGGWAQFQQNWKTILFTYLAICLVVRMAPIRGNLRGAAGAMLLLGAAAILTELIRKGTTPPLIEKSWMLLTFTVGLLLLLLAFSLVVLALVGLVRLAFAKAV